MHRSPALIAVEAESATDLPHRGTHAFLAATEVATVPNRFGTALPVGEPVECSCSGHRRW
jgi:hypothetical protein